jgi:hypothetical protein
MNGVLERMILRTRSHFAGLEPLFAPRYTAAAGLREPEDRPDAAQSVSSALVPPQPRVRSPRTMQTLPQNRAASAEADQIVEEISRPLDDATRVTPLDENSSSHLAPVPAARSRAQEPGARDLLPASQPVIPATAPDDAPPAAIGKNRGAAGAVTPERTALAAPAALPQHARSQPVEQALFATNSEAPPAPTQITISIGHVEVRAAPVSLPPRRPAFRPRVTLDEYLSRRSGDSR